MSCLKAGRWALLAALTVAALLVDLGGSQATDPPPTPCSAATSCDTCLQSARCLWCFSSNNCTDYPVSWLIPPSSLCPLSQAKWGMCWINFEALIISLGVVAGIIVLALGACCCYCCWCCCCNKKRPKGLRRVPHKDGIKGLKSEGDHPYNKFENE